jgi:phage baseplate assembly protein W
MGETMINSLNYNKIFVDFDLDFGKNELTKDLKIRTGISAVTQSIKNIVLTSLGERPFNEEIGVGLYEYLFNLDDQGSLNFLRSKIAAYLNILEPRIECTANSIEVSSLPGNLIQINISYRLKNYTDNSLMVPLDKVTITIVGDR